MRTRVAILIGVTVLASALIGRVIASAPQATTPAKGSNKAILYTQAKHYEPLGWLRGGERFPQGATIMVDDGSVRRPLVPDFAFSADANLSFDGTKVLFAGKQKPSDPWRVWEVSIDGRRLHRVTTIPDGAIRPMYLPDDRIVYSHKLAARYVIEAAPLENGAPLLLTYAPGSYLVSDVLQDGRVLFESGFPLGATTTPELYTVYPDGSGVESYRCDHDEPQFAGKQITSGDIVFATPGGLARFTSPSAHRVSIAVPAGNYAGDVAQAQGGDWLLAWRSDAKGQFEIKRWIPGSSQLVSVASEPSANLVEPIAVIPRSVPKRYPSALHDYSNANLLTLNAYTSKYEFAEGSIASLRAYTVAPNGKPKLLGSAPVEKDGSVFIKIQGDTPVRFELLDSSGKVLKRQNAWMWARRGEQRVCVGCHAGPEQSPENAVPAVLLRSTTPVDLTGGKANTRTGGR